MKIAMRAGNTVVRKFVLPTRSSILWRSVCEPLLPLSRNIDQVPTHGDSNGSGMTPVFQHPLSDSDTL